jgi:hypothetical protein
MLGIDAMGDVDVRKALSAMPRDEKSMDRAMEWIAVLRPLLMEKIECRASQLPFWCAAAPFATRLSGDIVNIVS